MRDRARIQGRETWNGWKSHKSGRIADDQPNETGQLTAAWAAGGEPRLLVVADNYLARAGLAGLLEERGCAVLAAVESRELQREIDRFEPDALVVDLGWRSAVTLDRLRELDAELAILALAADDAEAKATFNLIAEIAPQFALLQRESEAEQITAALDALVAGLNVIDPWLASAIISPGRASVEALASPLTDREHEVLQLLAGGLTNRAIGLELGITQHTVKFHVTAIMTKLEAQSRTEAVVRATQLGMIIL